MALETDSEIVSLWEQSGQAKIVVGINSEEELISIQKKAKDHNLPHYLVRDAGRTQIPSGSITVCAVGPGNIDDIDKVTGSLSLL